MWINRQMQAEIDEVARFFYVDRDFCARWNEARKPGEPRLLTG